MTNAEITYCRKQWNDSPLPSGKVIVDERCECGLRRSKHGGLMGRGVAVGCIGVRNRVKCPQFTWVGFVYADGTED